MGIIKENKKKVTLMFNKDLSLLLRTLSANFNNLSNDTTKVMIHNSCHHNNFNVQYATIN